MEDNRYISLAEATKHCEYSQDYLSLRARQGKLKAVKNGRNWVTTKEWLSEYTTEFEGYLHSRRYRITSPPHKTPDLRVLRKKFAIALVGVGLFTFTAGSFATSLLSDIALEGQGSYREQIAQKAERAISDFTDYTHSILTTGTHGALGFVTTNTDKGVSIVEAISRLISDSFVSLDHALYGDSFASGQAIKKLYAFANNFLHRSSFNFGHNVKKSYLASNASIEKSLARTYDNALSGFGAIGHASLALESAPVFSASILDPFTSVYKSVNQKITTFLGDKYIEVVETVIPGYSPTTPPQEVPPSRLSNDELKEIKGEIQELKERSVNPTQAGRVVQQPQPAEREIARITVHGDDPQLLAIQGDVSTLQNDLTSLQALIASSNLAFANSRLNALEQYVVASNRTASVSTQNNTQLKYLLDNIVATSLELQTHSDRVGLLVNQRGTENIIQLQDKGTDILTIADGGTTTINTGAAALSLTSDLLSLTDNNWNVSDAGLSNFVSIGATTPGIGTFTTLTSTAFSTDSVTATSTLTINNTSLGDPMLRLQNNGTNTWFLGFDNSDANKLRITPAGAFNATSSGLTINAAGFVGIGTTNPAVALDVSGALTVSGAATITSGSISGITDLAVADGGTGVSTFGGTGTVLYTTAADTLSSTSTLAINLGGTGATTASGARTNLGLGSASAVTFATLDTGQGANELYAMDQNVLTSSSPTFLGLTATTLTATTTLTINHTNSGDPFINFEDADTDVWYLGFDNSDSNKFRLTPAGAFNATSSGITIDQAGNVGIGTTNPGQTLAIGSGSIDLTGQGSLVNVGVAGNDWTSTNLTLADSVNLVLGTGGDLTLAHDGSNSTFTSTTGDLVIDNTNTSGTTTLILGSDTQTTGFRVQNNSANNLFLVEGDGDITLGADVNNDTVTVTAQFASNILPANTTVSVGSASDRWQDGFFTNLDVTNLTSSSSSISGTISSAFTINSDNVSADTENMSLAFERGSETPNATLDWDSTNDRFDFNFPLVMEGTTPRITIGDAGAEDTSLVYDGNAQDFYIALEDASDDLLIGTGSTIGANVLVAIENGGNVGIGTATPDDLLDISKANNGASASDVFLTITNASTTGTADVYLDFEIGEDTSIWRLGVDDSDSDKFRITQGNAAFNATSSGLTINAAGFVGIGTTNPSTLLHVNGTTTIADAISIGTGVAPIDGTRITLPIENDGATPTLTFGTDSGFYSSGSGTLIVSASGGARWRIDSTQLEGITSGAGGLRNEASSATNPTVIPSIDDEDTGLGANTADQLSLIAGGVEAMRFTESDGGITALIAGNATGVSSSDTILAINNASTTATADPQIQFQTGGTSRWFVGVDDSDTDRFVVATSSIAQTDAPIRINFSTGEVVFGAGAGKIDAGTIDPIYTIDGTRYATYVPSTVGIKEELVDTATLQATSDPSLFTYILDFSSATEGSDLWLFKNIIAWGDNMENLSVFLTPQNNTKVSYKKDSENNRVIIYGDSVAEVSYRLSAPRFDHTSWTNLASGDSGGFIVPNTSLPGGAPIDLTTLSVNTNVVPGASLSFLSSSSTPLFSLSLSSSSESNVLAVTNSSSTPLLSITSQGSIGIGTSASSSRPMTIKQGMGAAIADGWDVYSLEEYKTNIEYLDDTQTEDILSKIKDTPVARYNYKTDKDFENDKHLGLIVEQSPVEIISKTKQGISLYDLATFTLAGVKELAIKQDKLEERVAVLEMRLDGTGQINTNPETNSNEPQPSDPSSFLASLKNALTSLGSTIENNVLKVTRLVTGKLTIEQSGTPRNTIGEGVILKGATSTVVEAPAIGVYDKVFLTPVTHTKQPLFAIGKTPQQNFVVGIDTAATQDIYFNWWVVGVEMSRTNEQTNSNGTGPNATTTDLGAIHENVATNEENGESASIAPPNSLTETATEQTSTTSTESVANTTTTPTQVATSSTTITTSSSTPLTTSGSTTPEVL